MKIDIRSILNRGDIERERLILDVLSATDIGDYILLRAGYRGDSVTTGIRNAFWFPYKAVSRGDLIIIFTKSGRERERSRNDGSTVHSYFWGLEKAIWDKGNSAPVLLHAPDWESKGPDEL